MRPDPTIRRRRRVALVVAAACGVVPLLAPATAHAASPVDAVLECVWNNADGTRTAAFGYDNPATTVVTIPVGSDNRFTSKPDDRGQPTVFQPGVVHNAFVITFTGSTATWHLNGADANANPSATPCTSAPVPQFANWIAALVGLALLLPLVSAVLRRSTRYRRLAATRRD